MCFQDSSETCTRPSTPPRSTNAPKLTIEDTTPFDQRRGQEAAQADIEDQAALDDLDDGALDGLVLLLELFDGAPGALVLRTLLGQDQPAFFVLFGEDQGLDLIADGHNLIGV